MWKIVRNYSLFACLFGIGLFVWLALTWNISCTVNLMIDGRKSVDYLVPTKYFPRQRLDLSRGGFLTQPTRTYSGASSKNSCFFFDFIFFMLLYSGLSGMYMHRLHKKKIIGHYVHPSFCLTSSFCAFSARSAFA